MPDYSKAKIYRIYSPSNPDAGEYIGSTIEPFLSNRLAKHRYKYKLYLEGKGNFVSSYDLLDYDDVRIELIEECACENREQLLKKEGEFIRSGSGICINRHLAGRTRKDYYLQNKEEISEKHRKYRMEHKDEINERRRLRRAEMKNIRSTTD
jgi:hypothetical protein